MFRRRAIYAALAALAFAGAACDDVVYHYVDPTFRLSGEDATGPVGDPSLVVGFTTAAGFAPLSEDDRLRVIWGLQGGTWTMPTLRAEGLGTFVAIVCAVETDAGERVGAADAKTKLFPSPAGGLEILGFPIPIAHAPPHGADPIDDLYGQTGTFTCTVTDDDDRSATATYTITIEEG